jgi:hypothetical protein
MDAKMFDMLQRLSSRMLRSALQRWVCNLKHEASLEVLGSQPLNQTTEHQVAALNNYSNSSEERKI